MLARKKAIDFGFINKLCNLTMFIFFFLLNNLLNLGFHVFVTYFRLLFKFRTKDTSLLGVGLFSVYWFTKELKKEKTRYRLISIRIIWQASQIKNEIFIIGK